MQAAFLSPIDHSFKPVVDAVAKVLRALNMERVPPMYHEFAPNAVSPTLQEDLRGVDVVIADVSRGQTGMLFELGFAHALGKAIVLLLSIDGSAKLPVDLAAFQVITYDPKDLDSLRLRLSNYLEHLDDSRAKGGRL